MSFNTCRQHPTNPKMERVHHPSFMEALVKLLNMLITLQVRQNRVKEICKLLSSQNTSNTSIGSYSRFLVFNPAV